MFDTVLTKNFTLEPDDPDSDLTGSLLWDSANDVLGLRYDDDGVTEDLTTDLECWGYAHEPGCVFIKNEPPYSGLVERLADLGLVHIEGSVTYGPFDVLAHQIRPIIRLEAPVPEAA